MGVGRSAFRPRIHKARHAVVIRFRDCPRNCAAARAFFMIRRDRKKRSTVRVRTEKKLVGGKGKRLSGIRIRRVAGCKNKNM